MIYKYLVLSQSAINAEVVTMPWRRRDANDNLATGHKKKDWYQYKDNVVDIFWAPLLKHIL